MGIEHVVAASGCSREVPKSVYRIDQPTKNVSDYKELWSEVKKGREGREGRQILLTSQCAQLLS